MYHLMQQRHKEEDMIGDHARIMRESFARYIPQLLVDLVDLKKQIIEHQAAVEQVQESDPSWVMGQDDDDVTKYLLESRFHLKLKPGSPPRRSKLRLFGPCSTQK